MQGTVQFQIDMTADFPPEPMHLLYLGIQKQMLRLLLSTGPRYIRLRGVPKEHINSMLRVNSKWTPQEFSRKSRDLSYWALFKATEFRQILKYSALFSVQALSTTSCSDAHFVKSRYLPAFGQEHVCK